MSLLFLLLLVPVLVLVLVLFVFVLFTVLVLDVLLADWVLKSNDVSLVEFTYLVFNRMPGESYCRRLRSFLLV